MNNFEVYDNIKLLTGGKHPHPGSGPYHAHKSEIKLFQKALESVEGNKKSSTPVMVELGAHWALWSIMFRKKFSNGKSVIVEANKINLEVGQINLEANGFKDYSSYWGSMYYHPEYNGDDAHDLGPSFSFGDIYEKEKLGYIDLLHMDIQASEDEVMQEIVDTGMIMSIGTFVIGTHTPLIHTKMLKLLNQIQSDQLVFDCFHNEECGRNDGMIIGTRRK